MRIVGLTGSIACGKSTISRYLISRGFPVVDGDLISRELTAPGSPVLAEILHHFGERYINDNGNLNRRALGQLIFRDEHARSRLDALMAPHLKRLTLERIEQLRAEGAVLCFLDMPLLFEKGYDRYCDSVWCVWLPENVQISRLTDRDHLTEEDALNRIRAVMSSDEKAQRADYVIDNSGSVRQTLASVERLLDTELNASASSDSRQIPSPITSAPVSDGYLPKQDTADRYHESSDHPQSTAHPHTGRHLSGFSSVSDLTGLTTAAALSPAVQNEQREPEIMDRPLSARRQPSRRKTEWNFPVWIRIPLIAASVLLFLSIASYWMMSGYLVRREQNHQIERDAVSEKYHFQDFSNEYRGIIEKYAEEFNLKPAFVAAVIMSESSFRPQVRSVKSAAGLMQLKEGAASDRAAGLGISDFSFNEMIHNPDVNIRLGCCHLRYLIRKFGDSLPTVMVAYNVGEGNAERNYISDPAISKDGKTVDPDRIPNKEVQAYVKDVAMNYGIYQAQFYTDQDTGGASGGAGAAGR